MAPRSRGRRSHLPDRIPLLRLILRRQPLHLHNLYHTLLFLLGRLLRNLESLLSLLPRDHWWSNNYRRYLLDFRLDLLAFIEVELVIGYIFVEQWYGRLRIRVLLARSSCCLLSTCTLLICFSILLAPCSPLAPLISLAALFDIRPGGCSHKLLLPLGGAGTGRIWRSVLACLRIDGGLVQGDWIAALLLQGDDLSFGPNQLWRHFSKLTLFTILIY